MIALLHRMLIIALAAAFVVAGVGRAIAALQPCVSTTHKAAAHQHDHSHSHGHHGHGEGPADHHASHSEDETNRAAIDQSCLKCCGACLVVGQPIVGFTGAPEPIRFAVLYPIDAERFVGRPVPLDPGVPKTKS